MHKICYKIAVYDPLNYKPISVLIFLSKKLWPKYNINPFFVLFTSWKVKLIKMYLSTKFFVANK